MRNRLLALMGLLWAGMSVAAYDFDYRTVGDPEARPANVFDDGAATFFQFAPGHPVPAILKVGPSGEQLATWRIDGPYVVVDGVLTDWRLRLGRGIAAVRYSGTRQLALKGTLYGAAVPLSEAGPVATPVVPTLSRSQVPVAPMVSPAPTPGLVTEPTRTATATSVPVPAVPVPLPDFSGSFVVRMNAAVAQPPMREPSAEAVPAPMLKLARASHRVIERLSVRFSDLAPSASDQETLDDAARQAVGMGNTSYIVVRAYSGARALKSRQRYAALRGEEVRSALMRAGVDSARIRVVTATRRTASRADILFIGRGTQV